MGFPLLTPTTTIGHRIMETMLLRNSMKQTCSANALRISTRLLTAMTMIIAIIVELRVMGSVDLPTGTRTTVRISDKLMVVVCTAMGGKVLGVVAVVAEEVMTAGRTNVIGRRPRPSQRQVTVRTKRVKKTRGTLRSSHIQLRQRKFLPLEMMFHLRKAFLQRCVLSGRFDSRYAMKRMNAGGCVPCVDSNNNPNGTSDNKRPHRSYQMRLCGTIR